MIRNEWMAALMGYFSSDYVVLHFQSFNKITGSNVGCMPQHSIQYVFFLFVWPLDVCKCVLYEATTCYCILKILSLKTFSSWSTYSLALCKLILHYGLLCLNTSLGFFKRAIQFVCKGAVICSNCCLLVENNPMVTDCYFWPKYTSFIHFLCYCSFENHFV